MASIVVSFSLSPHAPVQDMLDVVDLEGRREPGRYPTRQGGFDLIHDGGPLPPTLHDEATSMPSLLGCHNPADPNQRRRRRAAGELQRGQAVQGAAATA